MKIYVISLPRSRERRASIRAQMSSLGIGYSFFDAIDGRIGWASFEGYDRKRFWINTGRTVSTGEVGCYASHLSLWNRCVQENEPVVVMEDDALIGADFPAALAETEKLIQRYGFIRLQHDGRAKGIRRIPIEKSGRFTLQYCATFPYGAMCYAIAPAVAGSFAEQSCILRGPVDLFIKEFWRHGNPLFALSSRPICASHLVWFSTARRPEKGSFGLGLRALRAGQKIGSGIERARFNLAFRLRRLAKRKTSDASSGALQDVVRG